MKAAQQDIDFAIKFDARYQLSISAEDARSIVRKHFELDRDTSAIEIEDLIVSLRRKQEFGSLDNNSEMLFIRLGLLDGDEVSQVVERQR